MASHEGSRKRLKVSRTEGKATSTGMASVASSSAQGINKSVNGCTSSADAACHHEQALKTLHTDLDAMRQLVTCKICHRLLYEPYSLACGHTYCYSCLSQWLVDTHKKTCPDCRTKVEQQPTPSYVIRELVLVFVSRNELLPDGETSEEHNAYVKEEADVVARDRRNTNERSGGLFKGLFKRRRPYLIRPIHDPTDGVDRCPHCNWELEEGFCNQCGENIDSDFSGSAIGDDSDLSDDDLDHELDAEDARAVWGADGQDDFLGGDELIYLDNTSPVNEPGLNAIGGPPAQRRASHALPERQAFGGARPTIDLRSSDDSESEEDDEPEGNLTGFVVGDDEINYVSSDSGEDTETETRAAVARSYGRRRAPVVVSDDDDDNGPPYVAPPESESDSEDGGPVARGSQRNRLGRLQTRLNRARARRIASEAESSEEDTDGSGRYTRDADELSGEDTDASGRYTRDAGGFSPLDGSAGEVTSSMRSSYDSESVVSTVHPMYEDRYGHDEDDDSDESDSDDRWGSLAPTYTDSELRLTHYTAIPTETPAHVRQPPPMSFRLGHLDQHRSRHGSALARAMARSPSPTMPSRTARRRSPPPPRGSFPNYPAARGYSQINPIRFDEYRPDDNARPQRRPPPAHPFQLENTLNNINQARNGNQNYNQRNQQGRSNQGVRHVSGPSSQSSIGGGVNVNSSDSSGSSTTVGHATSGRGRRKRVLSISSDGSMEERLRVRNY